MSINKAQPTTREISPYSQPSVLRLNYLEAVKRSFPAHYELFNNELYFSNMILSDWSLRDRTYKLLMHVSNVLTVTVKYQVRPFITRHLEKIYWLIRYKILFDNFHLFAYMNNNGDGKNIPTEETQTQKQDQNTDTKI